MVCGYNGVITGNKFLVIPAFDSIPLGQLWRKAGHCLLVVLLPPGGILLLPPWPPRSREVGNSWLHHHGQIARTCWNINCLLNTHLNSGKNGKMDGVVMSSQFTSFLKDGVIVGLNVDVLGDILNTALTEGDCHRQQIGIKQTIISPLRKYCNGSFSILADMGINGAMDKANGKVTEHSYHKITLW